MLFSIIFSIVFFIIFQSNVYADIPTAPAANLADGTKDWLDIGKTLLSEKIAPILTIGSGLAILVGVACVVFRGFQRAQEKEDLTIFFKTVFSGLVAATMAISLIYVGNQYIS